MRLSSSFQAKDRAPTVPRCCSHAARRLLLLCQSPFPSAQYTPSETMKRVYCAHVKEGVYCARKVYTHRNQGHPYLLQAVIELGRRDKRTGGGETNWKRVVLDNVSRGHSEKCAGISEFCTCIWFEGYPYLVQILTIIPAAKKSNGATRVQPNNANTHIQTKFLIRLRIPITNHQASPIHFAFSPS